ncbi:PDR/VanB family oxidoreductase [Billgrantia endophytica]|uniref:Oxidoreductase n=1 Tax=Billgrantia endophytica TaxID=2033802 RepID=A0A2N7TZS4_9GAMM|nr:PDR/VanB family oxidoreductase [Halomonas endophytica]PMR73663.1 oxidoreductase [Halomonas endophytica]
MSASLSVRVASIETITPVIKQFTLASTGTPLPPFSPGSHIVVTLPIRERMCRNAYSLLGDPADNGLYHIAVRRQDASRGGSRYLHEEVKVGDRLTVSSPANLFLPSWEARHHLLIAGGIGMTPFMSYLHEFRRRGVSYELHCAFRDSATGDYRAWLEQQAGQRLYCYESERPDFTRLLAEKPLGTHVYVCGPDAMLQAVIAAARDLGWGSGRVHYEAFAGPQPGRPFVARLARSGGEIAVEGESSLLEALEAYGVEVPNLCRGGVCGQCRTVVVEGQVEHRDSFLDDSEKQRHRAIMPCVSRAQSDTLILDL